MFSLILVFIIVVLSAYYLIRVNRYWKDRHVKSLPFIQTTFAQLAIVIFRSQDIASWCQEIYDKIDGRYLGTMQFGSPVLVVKDPELIKQVTVKNFENFPNRQWFKISTEVDPLMGCNLMTLTGQKWKNMRSILSPAFTSSKMRGMFTHMQDSSEQFVNYITKQLSIQDVYPLEMKDAFTRYTNDIIANSVFGVKCDSLEDRENEFYSTGRHFAFSGVKIALKIIGYALFPSLMNFFKITFFGSIGDYFGKIVEENITQREQEGIVRMDMIHLLMEARKGKLKNDGKTEENDTGFATVSETEHEESAEQLEMTLDAIKSNTILFFAAGLETTASVLSFLAYELAVNPNVQEKLQKEVDGALKKYNGQITYEGLLEMKYLDCAVCEVLRLWPPGLAINRQCAKPFTFEPVLPTERLLLIEKNVVISVPTFSIHRDPKYYENPNKFIPERFNDENKGNIQPYTYMPFGLGPRNCIGSRFGLLEVKTIIFYFLSRFNFVVIDRTDVPFKLARAQFNLNAQNGFWLGVSKRKSVEN